MAAISFSQVRFYSGGWSSWGTSVNANGYYCNNGSKNYHCQIKVSVTGPLGGFKLSTKIMPAQESASSATWYAYIYSSEPGIANIPSGYLGYASTTGTPTTTITFTFSGLNLSTGTYYIHFRSDVSKYFTLGGGGFSFSSVTGSKVKVTLSPSPGSGGTTAIWFYNGVNTIYSNEACTTTITKITVPSRTGYAFTQYNGSGSHGGNAGERYIYSDGTFATDLGLDITSNDTFTAVWTANQYDVRYSVNGGTWNSSDSRPGTAVSGQTYVMLTYDSSVIQLYTPSKTGYNFAGWAITNCNTSTAKYRTSASGSWAAASNTTYNYNYLGLKNLKPSSSGSSVGITAQWSEKTATLTFSTTDGGTGHPAAITMKYTAATTIPSTLPTQSGYTCTGWSTTLARARNGNRDYATGATYKAANVIPTAATLYAIWQSSVTYNANGGSGAPGVGYMYYTPAFTLSATKPTRTGYTFANWNTNTSNTGTSYAASASLKGASAWKANTILYAIWTNNSYSISYTLNGGSQATANNTVKTYTISGNPNVKRVVNPTSSRWDTWPNVSGANNIWMVIEKPTRTGYNFNGWNITGMDTNAHKGWSDVQSTTLTSTKASESNTSAFGKECTVYYNLRATSGTVNFAAAWTGISYSVAFNKNGGSGTMNKQTGFVYGTAKALTANAFTAPSGYSFAGWATSVANATAGTVAYANQANMTTGTTTSGGTVNLYAVWKRNITFYSGSSKATTNTVAQYYNGSSNAGAAITTPAGATISGWSKLGFRDDTSAGTQEVNASASITPSATTYYAVYSRTATFYHGYNKAANTTKTQYYNTNGAYTVTTPTAANCTDISYWTELGWRDDTTASTAEKGFNTAWNSSSATFYAVYSQAGTLTYNGNGNTGGSTANTSSNTRYLNSGNTTLSSGTLSWTLAANGFTKTGYTFNGWNIGAAGATYTQTIAYNANPARTANAQWAPISYSISYALNNGTHGNSHPGSGSYDADVIISNPTRMGYTFSGWTISGIDGGQAKHGTAANPSTTLSNNATGITSTYFRNLRTTSGTVTFTAVWTPITYTVQYNLDGGTQSHPSGYQSQNSTGTTTYIWNPTTCAYDMSNFTDTLGSSNGISSYWYAQAPTKNGYTFTGWIITNMSSDSNQFYYNSTDNHINSATVDTSTFPDHNLTTLNRYVRSSSGTVTYTAQYTPHTYTVEFKSGNSVLGTQSFTYGTAQNLKSYATLTAPSVPTSTYGWSFYGWATNYNTTTRNYADGANANNLTSTDDGTVTLYAIYKRNITFKYYNSASATSVTTDTSNIQYYRNSSTTAAGGTSVTVPALYTNSTYGWTPYGWIRNANTYTASSGFPTDGSSTSVTPSVTLSPLLYALYTRTVTLNYNANNGSGTTTATTGAQRRNANNAGAETITLTTATSTFTPPTGYAFDKWNTANDASGTDYAEGASYLWSNVSWTSVKTNTLYAIYKPHALVHFYQDSNNQWKPAFVYAWNSTNSEWELMMPYGYTSNEWKIGGPQ